MTPSVTAANNLTGINDSFHFFVVLSFFVREGLTLVLLLSLVALSSNLLMLLLLQVREILSLTIWG